MAERRIEVCKVRAGDLRTGFWNPRKIGMKKMQELEDSFERYGDFGVYLIDETNRIIAGNQRYKVVMKLYGPDTMLDCKRLIGYTENELKSINVKDNTHAGEWDLDILNAWIADLNFDLGPDIKQDEPEHRDIRDMELIRYEKYDYVLIACRNEPDYLALTRALGIDNAKVLIAGKRRIKARAIWYDDIKANIVKKPDGPANYDL